MSTNVLIFGLTLLNDLAVFRIAAGAVLGLLLVRCACLQPAPKSSLSSE